MRSGVLADSTEDDAARLGVDEIGMLSRTLDFFVKLTTCGGVAGV